MAIVQVNPPGLASTSPGYISSITVYTDGAPAVLTPSVVAATYGQITVDALAASQLVAFSKSAVLISG